MAETKSRASDADRRGSDAVELTFLGHALEGLAGTLDPVLVVIAFRRQQLYHGVATGGGGTAECRRGEVNRLAHLILVGLEQNFLPGHRLHRRARGAEHPAPRVW